MKGRIQTAVAGLALLAVAVLVLRPIALDAIGAPFGSYNSPDVQLVQVEGSPHCALLADCETVSISNAGLDLGQAAIVLVLSGLLVALVLPRGLTGRSWTALVPNPPPLSVS